MNRRRLLQTLVVLASASDTSSFAEGQKAITIVVPYAAGGTTDLIGRLLAKELAPLLKRTIIVENKAGAASAIGAAYIAKSHADARNLLIATSSTLAINPSLYKKLPYEPTRDFAPIGMIGAVPLVVVVNSDVPANTLAELLSLSKSTPKGLSYGSAGNGSPQHLAAEMFKAATDAKLHHVPFKGSAPAVADLLGHQIDMMFSDIVPVLQHLKAGKLRALAVTSAKRHPSMPDISTVAESQIIGTANFDAVAWQSLVAPAATPKAVIDAYSAALSTVLSDPGVRELLLREGLDPHIMNPQELAAYIQSETKRWAAIVQYSGAVLD